MQIAILLFCTVPESSYYFLWQRLTLAFSLLFSIPSPPSCLCFLLIKFYILLGFHIILFTSCEIGFCGLIWKASSFCNYNCIAIISFRWNLGYSNTLVILLINLYSQIIAEFLLIPLYWLLNLFQSAVLYPCNCSLSLITSLFCSFVLVIVLLFSWISEILTPAVCLNHLCRMSCCHHCH